MTTTFIPSYEQVARYIREQIHSGHFTEGYKLPSERRLAEQFGVSRVVVREAVKVLHTMGLVESRRGSGVYVRNDPIPTVSRALTLSVTPEEESIQGLFELRESLEVLAARLAAARRTQAQLTAIEGALADNLRAVARGDAAATHVADQQFHAAIGEVSGNPYLAAVLGAVWHIKEDLEPMVFTEALMFGGVYHTRITEAIRARASDDAAAIMAEHIQGTADRWRREITTREDRGDRGTE